MFFNQNKLDYLELPEIIRTQHKLRMDWDNSN